MRGLKARETKAIPLVIPPPVALKIDRRDFPNRVYRDSVGEVAVVISNGIGVGFSRGMNLVFLALKRRR
jgi:hypothetical protein